MKRFLKISAIILVYFIVCANGCNGPGETAASGELERTKSARDSISELTSFDSLPAAVLSGYEMAAINRLSDFSDYLRVFSDTSTGSVFRKKAGEMICGLFIAPDVSINLSYSPGNNENTISPMDFLRPGFETEGLAGGMKFADIKTAMPFRRENDTLCSGRLVFSIGQPQANQGSMAASGSMNRMADIYAVRHRKIFGRDTLKVWEVYLGEIE